MHFEPFSWRSMFIPVSLPLSESPGTELTHPLHSAHTALSRMLCHSRLLVVYSQTGLLLFCLEYEASERHSV